MSRADILRKKVDTIRRNRTVLGLSTKPVTLAMMGDLNHTPLENFYTAYDYFQKYYNRDMTVIVADGMVVGLSEPKTNQRKANRK